MKMMLYKCRCEPRVSRRRPAKLRTIILLILTTYYCYKTRGKDKKRNNHEV